MEHRAGSGADAITWDEVYRKEREHLGLPETEQPTALCLSGGGIRSATFALGVLQGLARAGLLDKFDYLSTVSGGGYIGSWLSAWIHRHPNGRRGVVDDLARRSAAEPHPMTYLRGYSDYLSPKLGLFSADTWTLAGIYLRNLLLNWCVLIPAIAAGLLVPRLALAVLSSLALRWSPEWEVLTLLLGLGAATFAVEQVGNYRIDLRSDKEGPPRARVIGVCVIPLLVAMAFLVTYWAGRSYWLHTELELPPEPASATRSGFLMVGGVVHIVAWLIYSARAIARKTWAWRASIREGVVVLLSGLFGGLVAWATATRITPQPFRSPLIYVCFAGPLFLVAFLGAATLFVGLTAKWTRDADREWWGRFGSLVLMASVAWAALSSIVVLGPMALVTLWGKAPALVTAIGGVSGIVSILGGRSASTPATGGANGKAGPLAATLNYATMVAAPVFIVIVLASMSLATSVLLATVREQVPSPFDPRTVHVVMTVATPLWLLGALFVGLTVFAYVSARFIDINEFSLHAMYRNRLVRAYLGASRIGSDGRADRHPDRFTNIDAADDVPIEALVKDTRNEAAKPLLVVNTALNLVKTDKPAWQERKAESFTVTALHSGNKSVGYRNSRDYAGRISLGTAITISGAAATPNMGYHSSPAVTFLMTLFNLRLGLWLGNPKDEEFSRPGPRSALVPMIWEACGLTTNTSRWVYLSDGGHFENLGLYEMVRRRCRSVVVIDASGDPDCGLEDLGNAIRKIRIDFGIRIDLEKSSIYSRKKFATLTGVTGRYAVVGTIRYADAGQGANGTLVYLKPAVYGDEPKDIFNYAEKSLTFPHETTVDQFFNESQFESYRMLGLYIVETICGKAWAGRTLADFEHAARSTREDVAVAST